MITRQKFIRTTAGAIAGFATPVDASVLYEITRRRSWSSHKLLSYGDLYENNPTISGSEIFLWAASAALGISLAPITLGLSLKLAAGSAAIKLASKFAEFWQEKEAREAIEKWRPEIGCAPLVPAPRIKNVDEDTSVAIEKLSRLNPLLPLSEADNQSILEDARLLLEKKQLPANEKDRARRLAIMTYVLVHLGRHNQAAPYADQATNLARKSGNDSSAFISGLRAISTVMIDPVLQAENAVNTLLTNLKPEDHNHFMAPAFYSSVGQNIALLSRSSHLRGSQALELLLNFGCEQFKRNAPNGPAFFCAASCAYLTALMATSADLLAYEEMKDSTFLENPICIPRFDEAASSMERLLIGAKFMAARAAELSGGPENDLGRIIHSSIGGYSQILLRFQTHVWSVAKRINGLRIRDSALAKSVEPEVIDSLKARAQKTPNGMIPAITSARVSNIESSQGFLLIDVGEYHRVGIGRECVVFRGSKRIGELRVTRVTPCFSICDAIGRSGIANFRVGDEALLK